MKPKLKRIIFWLGIGLIILALVIGVYFAGNKLVYRFLQVPKGRTNILVLGMAGKGYAGGDLADSMIFFSIDNQTGKVLALSLPRDIWIASLRTKLNSVYHYRGMEETKKTVSEIIGQPVDYWVIVDFNLFKDVINTLGGVNINVERAFDDYKYPLAGKENDLCEGDQEFKCRYEHLHFDAGLQSMNGERALKYVRSRNAEGDEGTDFARDKRQQKLLVAMKEKIFSPRLIKLVSLNIQTDIPRNKFVDFFKIGLRFRMNKLKTAVLGEDYLINPPPSKRKYDEQWVLVPKTGNWEEIQKHISSLYRF